MNDLKPPFCDPYEKCGPDCVAIPPILDTAGGDEHSECPDSDDIDWDEVHERKHGIQ